MTGVDEGREGSSPNPFKSHKVDDRPPRCPGLCLKISLGGNLISLCLSPVFLASTVHSHLSGP
jgi:hypothetical protein